MTGPGPATRSGSARIRAARPPRLIGRGAELAELTRVLAQPVAVALIEGEAGIGKSRLVREYLISPAARARKTLMARCPPFRHPHTLGPVTDALRQATPDVTGLPLTPLAGALRSLFPEWAADLPPAPERAEDAAAARHRLFRALAELISCLEAALVVVEDAHWADEATLEFLLYLSSREDRAAGLAVTYRPEDVPAGSLLLRLSRLAAETGGLRLTLGPLDVADTGALVSSMLAGEPVSDEFAAFVHQRTEGVPLAVEETVRLMADRADLARRDGGWMRPGLAGIAVPPTVRDAVLERASRLSRAAQVVLRCAAVLAEGADEAVLTAVSALPAGQAAAGLAGVLGSGLLVEDGRGLVSFRHALAGQAIYEAMPGPERRLLHLRSGHVLQDRSAPAARLARHFRAAGDFDTWSRYAERAADLALASGDEVTAADLLGELIDAMDPPDYRRTAALLHKITFASITDPACYRSFERSLRALVDRGGAKPGEEAELRFHLGRILAYREDHEASRAELERAIPHLTGHPGQAARAMSMLGWPHDATSPAPAHLRWLRRAARVASSLEVAERLPVMEEMATALLLLGEEEGWAATDRTAAEADASQDARQLTVVYLNSGDLAMSWGRYADAEQRLTRALDLAMTHHYQRYRELILGTQAHLDWFTGAWEGLAERVGRLWHDQSHRLDFLEAALVMGLLYRATGARAQAEDCLRYTLTQRRRHGAPYFIMEPSAALARLLLADGRTGDALAVTDEPAAIVAAKRTWVWAADIAPVRVEALLAAGRRDEASAFVTAFARGLRRRDAPAPTAAIPLCRAILARGRGDHLRAAALFGRTAAAWRSLPRPYDAWLAQAHQARCLLAAGDQDSGVRLLTQALGGLDQLGATGDVARIRRELRERGVVIRRRPPRGRRGYGNQLSPRELDVARELVTGGTNREIARNLFLSPKTVARHLDSAMHKLGVSSRTALAVRLVEEGVISGPAWAQSPGSRAGAAVSASRCTGSPG